MDFTKWFEELKSDEVWFTNATMNYSPETVTKAATQIYVTGMADPENFKVIPMKEHRRHLFNKLSKLPPDKVKKKWYLKESDKEELESQGWIPLKGEERAKWLKIWEETIKKTPAFKSTPKLTSQMIEEEGGVRPKAVQPYPTTKPSEAYVKARHLEYIRRNYDPYTGEKLPNWLPEEEFNIQFDNGLL